MPQVKPRVELLRHTYQAEEMVAMAAKLCYSAADVQTLKMGVQKKDQSRFLNKLVEMGHLSPVEHVSFTFGIDGVSRAFLAQITRHRIASFSVQSQRYVNKSGGFDYIIPPSIEELGEEAIAAFNSQMDTIRAWYDEWNKKLGGGTEKANEDARFVLPNASETKMVLTMNARELMHFFSLRCCNRAQWEIRHVAWEMMTLCIQAAPALFSNAGPSCVTGSCSEGKMSCKKAAQVREKMEQLRKDADSGQ
ncbi:MAG: FAD-dependent thymidylate synthase [Christensenellales bacterium]